MGLVLFLFFFGEFSEANVRLDNVIRNFGRNRWPNLSCSSDIMSERLGVRRDNERLREETYLTRTGSTGSCSSSGGPLYM